MTHTAKAQLRNLRMAPRKVRLLIDVIRGMRVRDAIVQLEMTKKHATRPVLKLLKSAIANAVNNGQLDEQSLIVKTAFVDGGPIMYRSTPRALGRATPIRKRTSHITIVLEGEAKAAKRAEKKPEEIKEEGQATEKKPVKKTAAKKKTTTEHKSKKTAAKQ